MAGLAPEAAHSFKFLFVTVLYTLDVMTPWVNIPHPRPAVVADRPFPPTELLVGRRI